VHIGTISVRGAINQIVGIDIFILNNFAFNIFRFGPKKPRKSKNKNWPHVPNSLVPQSPLVTDANLTHIDKYVIE